MEQFYYQGTAVVENADADCHSLLKASALLRYVEQISSMHARKFGMDDKFFEDHGVAFLVGKQALRFNRVPRRGETLTLCSRSEKALRGSIKRVTTLTDEAGQEVAMVDSRWIMSSLENGHILRQPGWTVEGYWNETVEEELPLLLHKRRDSLTSAGLVTARYSQCDLHYHINNAFYLDIVCDALPQEIMRDHVVKFASINYHREVPMGQQVEVFYTPSDDGWYFIAKHADKTAFECYLELEPVKQQKHGGMPMSKTGELFGTFFKIGAFTFGGGYAMVALLEHEFVEEKRWLTREEFLDMVAIAESTPGPVAVNSATYIGYKLAGVAGAAASTLAVCLPSFAVIYLISLFFDRFLQLTVVANAFKGIQACVIYLILSAGVKMLKNLQRTPFNTAVVAVVLAAMVGCSVLAVKFSSICCILLCGAAGVLAYALGQGKKGGTK